MKKISVDTVKKFLNERETEKEVFRSYLVGDEEFEVRFKTSMTVDESTAFVNRVVSGCFDRLGNYRPEYVEPMFQATILQMCTNLPVLVLHGEKGDDGGRLMDLNAMCALFDALDIGGVDSEAFQVMRMELGDLCRAAIKWRCKRTLALDAAPDVEAFREFGAAASAVRRMAEIVMDKADSIDYEKMMEYAGKLSAATEGMDRGGILKALVDLRAKEGGVKEKQPEGKPDLHIVK